LENEQGEEKAKLSGLAVCKANCEVSYAGNVLSLLTMF